MSEGQMENVTVHHINCASLRRDGDQQCSCKPARGRRSLDDVSGEEWNAAAASLRSAADANVPTGYDVLEEDRPEPSVAPSVDQEDLEATLIGWWIHKAGEEAEKTVPKAMEYGGAYRASDLTDLGRTMWGLMDQGGQGIEPTDGMLQELGIYFYIIGKLGRWTAAIKEGRSVSDDTLFDIGVYIKMVQRIREEGGWPV